MSFRIDILLKNLPFLLEGAWITISLSIISMFFATFVGLVVGLLNMSHNIALKSITRFYIEVIRGTPLLLQILVVYFVLPGVGLKFDAYSSAIIAISFCYAAYTAEIFRGAVESIPKGQTEASLSLGLSPLQTTIYVILPQTFRRVLPPLTNEFVAMLKDTSLVAMIALPDLTYKAKQISAATANVLTPYVGAALIYLIMTLPLTRLAMVTERKVGKGA